MLFCHKVHYVFISNALLSTRLMHFFCQFYAVWKKVRQRCWQIKAMPTYNADQGFLMNWDFWFPSETQRNNAIPTNLRSYESEIFTGQCVSHLASCHTHCHNHHVGRWKLFCTTWQNSFSYGAICHCFTLQNWFTWQTYNVCCLSMIYTVLTQYPFCPDLRTFVWRKN